MATALLPALEAFPAGPRGSSMPSARRHYPRRAAADRAGRRTPPPPAGGEDFGQFLSRTAPTEDELKEHVFDKNPTESFRHEAQYTANHVSVAPPEARLELVCKDRRRRPLPSSLRHEALEVLDRPLRCLGRTGRAPPGHPSDQFYDEAASRAPPQPIPQATQRHESEFLDTIERSLREGQLQAALWEQYAKRAEELLITMPLDKVLRTLKAFVTAGYRGAGLFTHIGSELAKEVKHASSTRLCQAIHWLARAGLRDPTLMALTGNEILLRLSDDFVVDMYIEVLNVHAKLDVRNPRLVSTVLRDLMPLFSEFSKDQCCAVAPLTVMSVLNEQGRVAYLARCAELGMGLPVRMTKPAVLRQFRLLEDCLRLDYHPTSLPSGVQVWLQTLRSEAEAQDPLEPTALSPVEEDVLRVLREEMDVAVTPTLQDGILTVHLVMGKTILEVLDSHADFYLTPAMGGQRLLRAETKLRQRLIWRRGWRLLSFCEEEWTRLTDDLYKKDLLEEVLLGGPRRAAALTLTSADRPL